MWYRREPADGEVVGSSSELSVWLFFQVAAGHFTLPILAATILFSKIIRSLPNQLAVANVCVTWIISGVCGCLLFYVGQHNGPPPHQGICAAQASLMSAVQPMTCMSLFVLAISIFLSFDNSDAPVHHKSLRRRLLLLVVYLSPYLLFGLFTGVGVALSRQYPSQVNRSQLYFYCSLDLDSYVIAVAVISTAICAAALGLQCHMLLLLSNQWRDPHRGQLGQEKSSVIIRSFVFTLFMVTSVILNLISAGGWAPLGVAPYLFTASIGIALFLLFASQPEVLYTWAFWNHTSLSGHRLSRPTYRSPSATEVPTLSSTCTSRTDSVGKSLNEHTQDHHKPHPQQPRPTKKAVQIIGKPEEAFKKKPKRPDTISTWGF